MKIRSGSRRIVFVFDNFVIKIPKITSWNGFIFGVLENLEERYWLVADNTKQVREDWTCPLAKIHYADRFGFCVVMERADVFPLEHLKENFPVSYQEAMAWAKGLTFASDIKDGNVGLVHRRVVFIDYGFSRDSTYLGNPVYCVHDHATGERRSTLLWKYTKARRKLAKDFMRGAKTVATSLNGLAFRAYSAYKRLEKKLRG
ncbi:MAG: hypothetical protein ACRDBQ_18665 [Shewanella sp.]